MSIHINKLINIHNGQICHLLGHGPSLKNHISKVKSIDRGTEIIFSVNEVDNITGIIPDYWLFSNPGYVVSEMTETFSNNDRKITVIFSDCYDDSNSDDLNKLSQNVTYYRYDSVHFKSSPNIWYSEKWKNFTGGTGRLGCQRGWVNCCDKIIENRLTIQELLQKHSGYNNHYSTGDTCIIHALAFSVLMGFQEIHIYGVDLDYSVGYYDGMKSNDSFDVWMDRIKSDFFIINESAKLLGIKLFFHGGNPSVSEIIQNNIIPEKIYDGSCKYYN